ncbi:hypothetical protein [Streptomyces chromofuscus]|uniref:Uncharacterized protein n=1 Tax=Streptomyces chromofuscus TaxID=42881 RepID=A0A7M2T351_STRCW|nr:hypothetical protein [Streptomyces chromofuscus]QOV43066.1 hypothetical protein IPT68_25290 [Streptomyces chromofuscus]GGS93507.1 hypothetical protein GCM10010254_11890 [Streptomyces chromofuscus]
MTLPTEITNCVLCRDLADTWWRTGSIDGTEEFVAARAFGLHVQEGHPDVLRPADGCDTCRAVLAILSAPFSPPGETITHPDGSRLHPSQLHFARHVLQDMREIAS